MAGQEPPVPDGPEPPAGADISSAAGPGCGGFHTRRDARNERRFNAWTFSSGLAYIGATAAWRWRSSVPGALAWLLTSAALLLAIQAIRSYLVFLREADELLRRIQTEALALGFGAGAVFSLFYPLLESLGAPRLDPLATTVVMMLSWSAGSWLGTRRYSGSGRS